MKAYFRKESLSSRYQKKARSRHGVSLLSRPYSTEFGYAQDDGDGGCFRFAKVIGIRWHKQNKNAYARLVRCHKRFLFSKASNIEFTGGKTPPLQDRGRLSRTDRRGRRSLQVNRTKSIRRIVWNPPTAVWNLGSAVYGIRSQNGMESAKGGMESRLCRAWNPFAERYGIRQRRHECRILHYFLLFLKNWYK